MILRVAISVLLIAAVADPADADPYRLRASALADSRSPVGLLVLDSAGEVRPWLSAEALVWTGAGGDAEADVLVVSVRARTRPEDELPVDAQATLGRFVVVVGALRPVHVDGASARVELPWDASVQLFGGAPVMPLFADTNLEGDEASRAYDWLAGGRASRALGDWGSVGLAYMHRREAGRLSDEEIGLDAGGAVTDDVDLGGRLAYDLVSDGLSEAQLRAAWRPGDAWRFEGFANQHTPSRILPATSLFSVLGDVASRNAGATARWRAAPRLDLTATGAGRAIDDELGVRLATRALLRLDERGDGAVSVEVRRESGPEGDWSGAGARARVPLRDRWTAATELELVVPDESDGRGELWPWALVALQWEPTDAWRASAALEASASPQYTSRFDALFTLARRWEVSR